MSSSQEYTSGSDPSTALDPKKAKWGINPGPYVGIITRHIPGSRMGEVEVYIADFDAAQGPDDNYQKVSYASPFYGTTFGTDTQLLPDTPATAGQSYGMWMVPPDLGTSVLVMFAGGNRNRGYWFACVYDSPSHHMVPGLARAIGDVRYPPQNPTVAEHTSSSSVLPVVEYSTKESTAFAADGLTKTPRYPHEYQAMVLVAQGLDRDPIRGAISSSSLRESPSNVYGISTPGRKTTNSNQVPDDPQKVIFRRGGHQFVMDDGAAGDDTNKEGTDQLIRLRTSGGHQILMNDTEKVLYIASSTGNQWLEFSEKGAIHIYGAAGIHMRSQGPMDFHSDSLISMNAPAIKLNGSGKGSGLISMTTTGQFSVEALAGAKVSADGPLSLSSMSIASLSGTGAVNVGSAGICKINGSMTLINTGMGSFGLPALPPRTNMLQDTEYNADGSGTWVIVADAVESICTVVPAHEPWVQSDGKSRPEPQIPLGGGLF